MPAGASFGTLAPMSDPVPFCEQCGRPGSSLSGIHVSDEGLVRWTLYRCGHVVTHVVIDDAPQPETQPEPQRLGS